MFKVKVTAKVQNDSKCLFRWYFLNHRTFCYQIWYGDAASWARVIQNFCLFVCLLLSSRSRSKRGFMWSKYDSFVDVIWTVYSLATKLGLMIHHQKPECPVKKKNGLLHSGSRSQWRVKMLMFVHIISSKPPNILFANLVLWYIIMNWSVMQKDWFAMFMVKVTAWTHMIKIWQLLLYLLNCRTFCYQT